MERVLLVGAGGFLGTVLRYLVGGWLGRLKAGWTFPVETMIINVSGCVVIGLLADGSVRAVTNGITLVNLQKLCARDDGLVNDDY